MKNAFLFLLAFLISTPAAAQTSDADLRALVERVERALADPGDAADREDAARALARAAAALERRTSSADDRPRRPHRASWAATQLDACIDLGTQVLSTVTYAAPALEQATAKCSEARIDAGVLQIAYGVFRETNYQQTAFARAVEFAQNEALFGKSEILEFATAKYRETQYGQTALSSGARLAARIPAERFACLGRAFETYSQTQYTVTALDNAAGVCSEPPAP